MSKCRSAVRENIQKTVLITGAARRLGRAIATD
ncbi:short-chain dehydrogenase, partial [Rhizobium sp. BR5]